MYDPREVYLREEVVAAVLHRQVADHYIENHPEDGHAGDDVDYADDRLVAALRDYVAHQSQAESAELRDAVSMAAGLAVVLRTLQQRDFTSIHHPEIAAALEAYEEWK